MATKTSRGKRRDTPRSAGTSLTRLTILDAFHGWVIPALTAPAALVLYVLYNIEALDRAPAVIALSLLTLATVLWAGLRAFISERTSTRLALLLAAYAIVWAATTTIPLVATIDPGAPLFTEQLQEHDTTKLPLEGRPGAYRLVVQGVFGPSQTKSARQAHYRLGFAAGDAPAQTLEGDFTERYMQQRLGRRGSTTVRELHTERLHDIQVAGDKPVSVTLSDIAPADTITSVTLQLYPDRFPVILLAGLGLLLTCGAVVIDAWRPRGESEGLLTTLTLATVLSIASLSLWGGAHPGFGQLAGDALGGSVVGTIVALALARVARPLIHRLPAAP
ncbi:MAG: hypothetical protein HYR72_00200 [Deltaproteobacteria bacterium]|nr:hypothetical protein [Deltaproteobacteria bacterium]MBI3386120.1 hypothetical protein [Deltaproteobacteria bacterium]